MSKLKEIEKEYNELMEKLACPEKISDWDKIGEQKKILENIMEKKKEMDEVRKKIEENNIILQKEKDKDLLELAQSETEKLKNKEAEIIENLKRLIGEKEEGGKDKQGYTGAAIVEIRAGAGGEEASLFAADLFNMYARWAETKNITFNILSESKTDQGGYKEISFKMQNKDPYSLMRYEAGVHRVQRIPCTEKSGRIHTSTVSVAVLPEPKKGQIKINPQDIKMETCKASGPGGQYVNKRETAIRIIHIPTNTVVASQNERSLQQNKETALSVLEAKLWEEEQRKRREKQEKERKTQIGAAMRAEKIRTYNFPQNRVTDHRIEQSWHNLEEILGGRMDEIINALQEAEEREKYKEIVIE